MEKRELLKLFKEWGRGKMESGGRGEFKYNIFDKL
jgi:hypothetical protein